MIKLLGTNMLRIFMATVFSLLLTSQVHSELSEGQNGVAHGIGIGGTVHRTWGFNYRQYFESNLGITVNFGGWLQEAYGHLGSALGMSYTFAHHQFTNSRLPESSIRVYGVAYLAGIYENHGVNDERRHSFDLGLGAGPGAEFFFTKNFSIHLELPWMTFVTFSQSKTFFARSYPHFGGGISYYF